MLGFRLYKKTIIKRDILTVSIAFVLLFLSAIYMDSRNASSSLDVICLPNLGSGLLFIIFGTLSALFIAHIIVCVLILFCNSLFDAYCIKYYLSDTLDNIVEHTDDDYLKMIYTGDIPYIDDEYIDELDYSIKYVKVDSKKYENLQSLIYSKKRMEEHEKMTKLRRKYENSKIFKENKLYLGK